MNQRTLTLWISIVGIIGILFGAFYAIYGLEGFPAYSRLIANNVFNQWSNGLYGAVFIGFSVLLYSVGRYAFTKKDTHLMKILLYGVGSWLLVEALFSLYYGVYFNVGVDALLIAFLGYPLLRGIRTFKEKE